MNCTEIAPLLEDLLGGEIPEEAEASVRAHLADCPGCHRAWEWMCFTREAFQALPPASPRAGFEDRLGQILGIEIAPVRPLAPPPLTVQPEGFLRRSLAFCRRQPGVQWTLAASLLTAALGGGFYLKTPLPAGIGIPAVPQAVEARPLDPRPAAPDEIQVPSPIAAPARPAPAADREAPQLRASLAPPAIRTKTRLRQARPAAPAVVPAPAELAPESLAESDSIAGLDAAPMLGYVRAQDLPSPLRCQMGGSWPDCSQAPPCPADRCGAAEDAVAATTTD